jgi:WD40 repeat protein
VILDSPYKGLVPFEDNELDALLFYGRERESEIIAANVLASRLTVLYGPSGVGKSSVLRAGVAHRLRRQAQENVEEGGHPEFAVVVFDAWSDDPIGSLRAAVREGLAAQFGSALLDESEDESLADTLGRWTESLACDLLLVLDQAEEYFLYHPEETGFARELPELVTRNGLRVRVLLALRDDALAKLDRFKGRIPNLFANYLRLDHLDRSSARDAIVKPVERYNEAADQSIELEPALIEAVLDQTAAGKVDIGDAGRGIAAGESEEGRIEAPYLQLVLERIWEEEREVGSGVLRAATLARLGGAEAIVRTHLHRAVEALSADEKDLAADVFRYLVTPSGAKVAHGVGDLAEYASTEEQRLLPVLATLGRERIVRPVDGTDGGGGRYEIFHDVLGNAVLAWRRERERERDRRIAERRQRRLALFAGSALVALAAMTAVAIYAFSQRAEARQHGDDAQARALVAQALSQLGEDPELSLLLGLKAAGIERSNDVENVLRRALEASRLRSVRKTSDTARVAPPPGGRLRVAGKVLPGGAIEAVATSPDGRLIATGHSDATARLWSAKTARPVREFAEENSGHVIALAFSPNGELLATGSTVGTASLWRVADGFHITTLIGGHIGAITAVAFNPRGDFVATGSRDRTIRIWDTKAGRPMLTLNGHTLEVTRMRYTRGGSQLVSASTDGTERIWDAEPEPRMHVIRHGPVPKPGQLVDEVGDKRATAAGKVVVVRDLRSGSKVTLQDHKKAVTSVHFDGTGRRLLTTSENGDAFIWDTASGTPPELLRGHFSAVSDAGFSPDGRWVVTAGPFAAGLWRVGEKSIHTFIRNTGQPLRARFTDNHRIVTVARDGVVRAWVCDICGGLDELVSLARKRLAETGRTLRSEERRQFSVG